MKEHASKGNIVFFSTHVIEVIEKLCTKIAIISHGEMMGVYKIEDLKKEGIIIMGNEGNGISQAVRPFITRPLRIPSYPKDAETSESLNVAIATAIVLAEFRRQV